MENGSQTKCKIKTIQFLKEKRYYLCKSWFGDEFLDVTLKARSKRTKLIS